MKSTTCKNKHFLKTVMIVFSVLPSYSISVCLYLRYVSLSPWLISSHLYVFLLKPTYLDLSLLISVYLCFRLFVAWYLHVCSFATLRYLDLFICIVCLFTSVYVYLSSCFLLMSIFFCDLSPWSLCNSTYNHLFLRISMYLYLSLSTSTYLHLFLLVSILLKSYFFLIIHIYI